MITQTLTVFIKDELLSIGGNGTIKEKNKNKRNRSLKSVQNKFRRVSSERQLRRWKEQLHSDGNRIEKLSYISKFTHNLLLNKIHSS